MSAKPRCQQCHAEGPFYVTPDRILHIERGHVGRAEIPPKDYDVHGSERSA